MTTRCPGIYRSLGIAPGGRLEFALTFTVEDGKITEYTVIADPARLGRVSLAVLG